MAFSSSQIRMLNRPAHKKYLKARQVDGKTLTYIEGWHIISHANRVFGSDGWDRETLSSECVWRKPVDDQFGAAYITRVRISVRAGEATIVREGLGAAEAIAPTPGQAHEKAIKASETDATKRALTTFGNCFGLFLYLGNKESARNAAPQHHEAADKSVTPHRESGGQKILKLPAPVEAVPRVPIDKSQLFIGEPKRARSQEHLKLVAREACLICGRRPSQAHHLRFAQPRALARKVSDEFCVPLCAFHHSEVHRTGNEYTWWQARGIDAMAAARSLWDASRNAENPNIASPNTRDHAGTAASAALAVKGEATRAGANEDAGKT